MKGNEPQWPAFVDWALKAVIGGSILFGIQVIQGHNRRLDEIQTAITPLQYDIRALTEKGIEQREAVRQMQLTIREIEFNYRSKQ